MTCSTDLLLALYGSGYAEPINIQIGDTISSATISDLEAGDEPFRFFPIKQDAPNLAFIYGTDPDADLQAWKSFKLRPTAVMAKENPGDPGYGLVVYFWAVETPVPAVELQPVIDKFDLDLEEAIPTPSIEGWTLLHADPNECQTVEALIERYGAAPDDEPPEEEPAAAAAAEESLPCEEHSEPTFWGAARIATPGYDPATDPELDQVFTISLGARINSKDWNAREMTGRAIWQNLSNAKMGTKDGAGFVGGDLAGTERKANNVKTLYVPGLDVDVGMPLEEGVEMAKASGYKTLIHTTHSHMKSRLDIAKIKVTKWMDQNGRGDEEIDDDAIRGVMKEQGYYPHIYENATFLGIKHIEGGIVAAVETPPIPKFRMVFLMKEPFVFAEVHKEQLGAINIWKKEIIPNIAAKIGIPYDHTGVDPSRLFLLPRYREGQPHECIVVGGELIDWKDFRDEVDPLTAAVEGLGSSKSNSKSQTPGGKKLGEWWSKRATGFMAADLIQNLAPDHIRADVPLGLEIECPFDEEHSNPGDPADRACLVTNAGELSPDYFTFKCQHEGCRKYTALDMVGKCITNEWFTEEDIWSEDYNAVEGLEGKSGQTGDHDPSDDDEEALRERIRALGKSPPSSAVKPVYAEIRKYLNEATRDSLVTLMAEVTKIKKTVIAAETTPDVKGRGEPKNAFNGSGVTTLYYYGADYNEPEIIKSCNSVIMQQNRLTTDKPVPAFTWLENGLMALRENNDKWRFERLSISEALTACNEHLNIIRIYDKNKHSQPKVIPLHLFTNAYHQGYQYLPETPLIMDTPFYSGVSGQVIYNNGWHREDKVLLGTLLEFEHSPVNPTQEMVTDASKLIREEFLGEFKFLDAYKDKTGVRIKTREPSEFNAIAYLLTYFMKSAIEGVTPIIMIQKPTPNCGGSFLAKMIAYAATGREPPVTAFTEDTSEMQKIITSMVVTRADTLFLDDVRNFENETLRQVATTKGVRNRKLGGNTIIEANRDFMIVASGINVRYTDEMARRLLVINMNPQLADDEERSYSKTLASWLHEHRTDVVFAVLVLIENWIAKGRPLFKTRKLDNFEEWGEIVGGVIEAAFPDHRFLDNGRKKGVNEQDAAVNSFVKALYEKVQRESILDVPTATLKVAFAYASVTDDDILEKGDDRTRRISFRAKMEFLNGRFFKFGDKRFEVVIDVDEDYEKVIEFHASDR